MLGVNRDGCGFGGVFLQAKFEGRYGFAQEWENRNVGEVAGDVKESQVVITVIIGCSIGFVKVTYARPYRYTLIHGIVCAPVRDYSRYVRRGCQKLTLRGLREDI